MDWSTSNLTSSQEVAVHTKQWSIDVFVSEDGDNTNARAVLHGDSAEVISGTGFARRNPHDPAVPEIGDELAVARALRNLADNLLQVTADDILLSVGEDARIN